MKEEILEMLPSMELSGLWQLYDMHFNEKDMDPDGRTWIKQEDYHKVKYGNDMEFDIRMYLLYEKGNDKLMRVLPKSQIVRYQNRSLKLDLFLDELEKRKAKMRKTLMIIYSSRGDPFCPR